MNCGNCGSKLRAGASFCIVCGADVEEATNESLSVDSSDSTQRTENPIKEIQRQEEENNQPQDKLKEQKREETKYAEPERVNNEEFKQEYIEQFIVCHKCGNRVIKGSRFCNRCGKTL
ncbi:zinc-ribbon domain-containing protein [Clostridium grantii]|uniref:Double zinc ribbon n=1 Tax=Clostridium grantii DSM 8605 TaxID=1121316 RepID=A0A1M5QGL7_9CLOT|nr:zinc-ribbon domain-containing protein [Clostridium grantii]SHH13078.1 Double zinc ribbon [Clostridium grantii DSM 8605]